MLSVNLDARYRCARNNKSLDYRARCGRICTVQFAPLYKPRSGACIISGHKTSLSQGPEGCGSLSKLLYSRHGLVSTLC